jgi:hypothetical protein
MKISLIKTLIIFGFGLYSACANQGAPPGGPPDQTPPYMVHTISDSNATNVSRTTAVEFEFSESIDAGSVASSVEGAVFISPNPGDDAKLKVKGRKIRVEMADSLIADITYTITLGTGIKDLRRNALKESYTLGFSTGEKLDRKQINGRVFAEKSAEVTVWSYFLDTNDEIDPTIIRPAYATQCDEEGNFRLANLASRNYRLFAVRDRNKNQLYDKSTEQIGVTSSDVDLRGENQYARNMFFRMMLEDTSLVRIVSLDQADRRHLRIRFSRAVHPGPKDDNRLSEVNGRKLSIVDLLPDPDNPNLWSVTTLPRDSLHCELLIKNLKDTYGRPVSDSIRYEFKSVANPDTTSPRIRSVIPPDSSRMLFPGQAILANFSEAIDTSQTDSLFTLLQDSTTQVRVIERWNGLRRLEIWPDSTWSGTKWMRLNLDSTKIKDLAGHQLSDSKTFAWKVLDLDTLSAISGKITDRDSLAWGRIFLQLKKDGEEAREAVAADESGSYRFGAILPGRYILSGFRDSDNNGLYSFGSTFPFLPAERFFVAQDTILVRARWPNEGNNYVIEK